MATNKIIKNNLSIRNGLFVDKRGSFWYKNDVLHREDGPAIELKNGNKHWFIEGKRHREDGPALIFFKTQKYFKEDLLHREDGPAINEGNFGSNIEEWYYKGQRHRLDGPAFINHYNKTKQWYYKGKYIKCSNKEEFNRLIKLIIFI